MVHSLMLGRGSIPRHSPNFKIKCYEEDYPYGRSYNGARILRAYQ